MKEINEKIKEKISYFRAPTQIEITIWIFIK